MVFRADGGSGSIVILKYIRLEVDCTPVLKVVLVFYRALHLSRWTYDFSNLQHNDSWADGVWIRGKVGWVLGRGARWDGCSVAAPGGSARDQKRTLVLPRFWPMGYTEIGSRGNVFGTIFGFIFRTQNRPRFSASLKETLSNPKKRPHFEAQKTDLKMVPKIARGFLVFGFDGVRFSTAGGPILGPRGGQHGRARRGPEGRTGGQFWSNLRWR